jgi:hypothetical protein
MTIRKGDPDPVDNPDIEIGASVKVKRVRFRKEPKTKVEMHGEARTPEGRTDLKTSSGSERANLPEEVEPGVTYRDVRLRWQASARLEDPDSNAQSDKTRDPAKEEKRTRDEEQGQR